MKIKDLPKVDRPREKLGKYGPGKLNNSELLAILLGSGIKGLNVVELSNRILKQFGGKNLSKITFEEFKKVKGLGPTKAGQIIAALELGKRLLKDEKSRSVLTPTDVWAATKDIHNHKKEHFLIFFLDSRNTQIGKHEIISVGTLTASLVHPREVFEPAIACNAAQIIIAHNHPSGDTEPSEEDLKITKRLSEAGKLLGIELLDHIIVANKGFKSLREQGLL